MNKLIKKSKQYQGVNGYEPIARVVRKYVSNIVEDVNPASFPIEDSQHLIDDIDLDSMALLEILAVTEKKFGVSIPESEFPNFGSVKDITETVIKYRSMM